MNRARAPARRNLLGNEDQIERILIENPDYVNFIWEKSKFSQFLRDLKINILQFKHKELKNLAHRCSKEIGAHFGREYYRRLKTVRFWFELNVESIMTMCRNIIEDFAKEENMCIYKGSAPKIRDWSSQHIQQNDSDFCPSQTMGIGNLESLADTIPALIGIEEIDNYDRFDQINIPDELSIVDEFLGDLHPGHLAAGSNCGEMSLDEFI